jgi:hypothetical protein
VRADSSAGRIIGALARVPPGVPATARSDPASHYGLVQAGQARGLSRSSTAGRIVAALARTETGKRAAATPAELRAGLPLVQPPQMTGRRARRPDEAPTAQATLRIVASEEDPGQAPRRARPAGLLFPAPDLAPAEPPTPSAVLTINTLPQQLARDVAGIVPSERTFHVITTASILGSAFAGIGGAILTLYLVPGSTLVGLAELLLALVAAVLIAVRGRIPASQEQYREAASPGQVRSPRRRVS